FGAFFFLKMLEKVGAIDQLKNDFKAISTDKQHQVLLIGFCFALILAAVAPGGSNFVIAAIMLVSLGFNRIGVGVLCLFGNSISSVFGLLGVSIIALKEVTGLALLPISGWIGIYMIVLCIFAPLVMNIVYTEQGPLADFRDPDLKEDIILLMGMGAVYGTLQALVAYFAGPELPTIIAGGATLVFVILYERYVVERNILKKTEKHASTKRKMASGDSSSKSSSGLLSRPYFYAMGLMVFLLLVTRLVPWVKDFLTMDIITLKLAFNSISADKVMEFSPFYSPGTILFVTTLTVPLFVKVAAKYFPGSEMESAFIDDLTPAEITSIEDAEVEIGIMKRNAGSGEGKGATERRIIKEKPRPKKISTSLTEEMKKTAEKIKSSKVKDGKKESLKKKSGMAEPEKALKKKKKKKKKKAKIDTSETDTDENGSDDGANPIDEDDEDENRTLRGGRINREKRRQSLEAKRKKGRKLVNDGGDYEVEFDDDDYDDLDWDEADDDDDMEFEFDEDDYNDESDEDFFHDSHRDSGEEIEENVKKVRIDVLAHAIHPRKMINRALLNTAKDVAPILLAIVTFIAMANIMRYFNMTSSIAINIVKLVGDAYVFFIPIIGMSGSALTGSTTTSNVLFGGLHIEAATRLGLPTVKVAAAQVLGSSAGEMISPMNAVVIATAIGLKNKESILIKRLLPTFAFWLLLCTIISVVFVSI
ncbi:MAG: L-lactate permease, partial [Candidatus Thermoplasmatota archaeon]|nr:L-lactate permease [Candidatus Thermoplasmatota archaeon]